MGMSYFFPAGVINPMHSASSSDSGQSSSPSHTSSDDIHLFDLRTDKMRIKHYFSLNYLCVQ